ncbi:MAG: BrnT family toxin [Candidatus Promineofilum sp.]|uniref:BrnT family toxin n=1 Tax=Promineifilum sp. TaxID=2664178 RepID=UPI001D41A4D4|nr:BrnT family toxin [Caldilineaceae bacterium]MCB9140350.1 BrnT family toxin [Caldilineaceae bacterium]MCO5182084.1 BrnT family toxin [Promineifilum sp.]
MNLEFEWEPDKAARNLRKHNVSFQEAATAFGDETGATVYDPDHSEAEDRFLTIGYSNRGRLLIVSHTDRDDRIRIISARLLKPSERRQYE